MRLTWLSPPEKRGRPAPLRPLTETQRQFAADNHDLIYSFLQERALDMDCYDTAVFGYLRAVQRYLSEPRLHRYQFSTVAWWAMRQSVMAFHRTEERQRESEQRYWEQLQPLSPFKELEAKLLLCDLAAVSSREQYAIVVMRLQGYSVAETARVQGMSEKRVRALLKKLYQTYLCQCEQRKEVSIP